MKIPGRFLFIINIFIACLFFSCRNNTDSVKTNSNAVNSLKIFTNNMRADSIGLENQLKYADSALQLAVKEKLENKIDKILAFKRNLQIYLKDYDESIKTSNLLLKRAELSGDSLIIAGQSLVIGYNYYVLTKKDSAYPNYRKALDIYLKYNDSSKAGRAMAYMAIIKSDYGKYIESDVQAVEALNYLDENDEYYLTAVYNCIAISAKERHDYKEAIYWYDKAIEISTSRFNTITYINNKANSYRYLKEYNTAISLWRELLIDSLLQKKPKTKARVIDNLAFNEWLVDPTRNPLPKLLEAQEMRISMNDKVGLNASYAHLSDYYKTNDVNRANRYAQKMYLNARLLMNPNYQLHALERLIETNPLGNSQNYYLTYVRLSDSISQMNQLKKNQFAKLRYDSDKNREENLNLRISSSVKALELEKEKSRTKFLFISGTSIFLFLMFFIYSRKQKHQIEKRAEVYKTEKRIAKKIHDEVANNVVNIMNQVQYTDKTKLDLLDDIEKVYMLTRDISHENNSVETGEKFEQYLIGMIDSFNSDATTIILKGIHDVQISFLVPHKQIEVYRVLQELLINMRNHSKATLVAISFKKEGNKYRVNCTDNGVGTDLQLLKNKSGLKNVETRIKSISGSINFETSPDNGFKTFISFKS